MILFTPPTNLPTPVSVSEKLLPWGWQIAVGKEELQVPNRYWTRFHGGWLHPSLDSRDQWAGDAYAVKAFVWEGPGRNPEKVNLQELQEEWLKHDSYWGGAVAAKPLRYLDSRNALGVFISECVAGPSGTDLAVLNFHNLGSSTGDLESQYLVRIDLHPLRIARIRPLRTVGSDETPGSESRRFYQAAKHLYFIDGNKLNVVTWTKQLFKPVAPWNRSCTLTGFCGRRWILTSTITPNSWETSAFDLNTFRSFPVIRSNKSDPALAMFPRSVSETSDYILWERIWQKKRPDLAGVDAIEKPFIIHLPDKSTRPLAGPADTVARDYALSFSKPFTVYDAKTGKLIYRAH